MPTKKIICLANSRKYLNRCVAGKTLVSSEWLRPVSNAQTGELGLNQIQYADNAIPRVLDIVKIGFGDNAPKPYQPENMLIDNSRWGRVGNYKEQYLDDLCDHPDSIFGNEMPRDRVNVTNLAQNPIQSSLCFIKVGRLSIRRKDVSTQWNTIKKQVRAVFEYKNIEYDLVVTDLPIEEEYKERAVGLYPINHRNIYLCISLGEPLNGFCYKLVAAVVCSNLEQIRPDIFEKTRLSLINFFG